MKKRDRFWLFLASTLLAINLIVGYRLHSAESGNGGESDAFEKIGVMMRVLQLIRKDYVDGDKIGYTELIYNALHGMVNSLDPFSDFMPPEKYREMIEETEGHFDGIGIVVNMADGVLTIERVINDTPGARAGLQAEDQITHIEKEDITGVPIGEAVSKLKGKAGTSVNVTVFTPATKASRELSIERAVIPVVSVTGNYLLPDSKIGYLHITQFSDPTAEQLEKELKELLDKNAESLIIDLRNNPGGLLTSAVDICSFFLKPKQLVVSTEGRRPSQKQVFNARRSSWRFPGEIPIVILINENSASAAEILSGCLKDHRRAVLVGKRSYGKGSVQNIIDLPDGSALRLTTAKYYTPSRRVIHKHGVDPDIEVILPGKPLDKQRIIQETIENRGDFSQSKDLQLKKAVEILRNYSSYEQACALGKPKEKTSENNHQ